MDKLKMAHDWAMRNYAQFSSMAELSSFAWQYADAMQAEADKRKPSGLPEALREEWQPDWSQAPETAIAWKMQSESSAVWIHNKNLSAFEYSIAPSFGFTGNWQDSLRERPL